MKRTLPILIAIVLLLPAAFWAGRETAPPASEPPSEPAPTAVADPSANAGSSSARQDEPDASGMAEQTAAPSPLPPADTPLAQIKDELAERARAGDTRAACRLGADLMRCRARQGTEATSKLLRSVLQTQDDKVADSTVDALASMADMVDATDALCTGISDEDMREAIIYQRMAAERGDARMRLWYTADPALDRHDFLSELDEWERYRAVALDYLQQALAAGDPYAPTILEKVYMPRTPTVRLDRIPLRLPDEQRWLVYRELTKRLHPDGGEESWQPFPFGDEPTPGPDVDMAAVQAEAESLLRRYYPAPVPTVQPLAPGTLPWSDDASGICGE